MRRLRLVVLIQYYAPMIGGAERQAAETAQRLRLLGVDVTVITRRVNGREHEQIRGVDVYRVGAPGGLARTSLTFTASALVKLRQLQPDVIHAYGLLSPARTALVAQRIFRMPFVVTVQNLELDAQRLRRTPLGKQQLQQLWRRADTLIALNRETEQALAQLGVPAGRRRWVPNGVDADHFAPVSSQAQAQLAAGLGLDGNPRVIFVGRLVPEKCVANLLAAWANVHAAYPQAHLYVVGDGPLRAALQASAPAGVSLLGEVQDPVRHLQAGDIFVLPSATEGMSLALLEAMASGLPAIATDVGGARDVIRDGANGLLVPAQDIPALAHALKMLVADKPLRARVGCAARETILQKYQLATTTQALYECYLNLLAPH